MPKKIKKECNIHGLVDFVLEGRGYYRCRQCRSDHVARHRKTRKKKLIELYGGKCSLCGYDKCQQALQFHHLSGKDFEISEKGLTRSWDKMVEETKKCVLLCANCHAEVENGIVQLD